MNDRLIERVMIECPICDEMHYVEKRERLSKAKVKGEIIEHIENYYICDKGTNAYEFTTGKMMDENLLSARNAYRVKHNMLTSHEIIQLRKKYGLTQKELSLMLGWGEITVTRYETRLIQDETHDDILKTIRDDALEALSYLQRNSTNFAETRYTQIAATIEKEIEKTSSLYFEKKQITALYIPYQKNRDATGGIQLDIEKAMNMMLFFANKCVNLYKVKLMKLLWYADALYFNKFNIGMSGLVYQHMPMGALPVAHWNLMELIPVEKIDSDDCEMVAYKVLPVESFDESVFSKDELEILYTVANKFSSFTGKQLAEYMHHEIAYTQTKPYQVIPYSLSKEIRKF